MFWFHFTRLRFSALFDVFQSISLTVFLMFMKIYACVIFLYEAGPSISSLVVLYGNTLWSLALMGKLKLQYLKNNVPVRFFGGKYVNRAQHTWIGRCCRLNLVKWGQYSLACFCWFLLKLNIIFLCVRRFGGFYISDIIDGLAEQMDRTDSRVRNETRQVTVINRKDNTCCKFYSLVLDIFIIWQNFKVMAPCIIIQCEIKTQPVATVCSLIYFTAKSLYMFRVSQHPSSGVLKTVTAAAGTGHSSFQFILVFYNMTCTGGCSYSS